MLYLEAYSWENGRNKLLTINRERGHWFEDPLTRAPTAILASQELRKEAGFFATEEQDVRTSGKG